MSTLMACETGEYGVRGTDTKYQQYIVAKFYPFINSRRVVDAHS